jgi:chorismate synthase
MDIRALIKEKINSRRAVTSSHCEIKNIFRPTHANFTQFTEMRWKSNDVTVQKKEVRELLENFQAKTT